MSYPRLHQLNSFLDGSSVCFHAIWGEIVPVHFWFHLIGSPVKCVYFIVVEIGGRNRAYLHHFGEDIYVLFYVISYYHLPNEQCFLFWRNRIGKEHPHSLQNLSLISDIESFTLNSSIGSSSLFGHSAHILALFLANSSLSPFFKLFLPSIYPGTLRFASFLPMLFNFFIQTLNFGYTFHC